MSEKRPLFCVEADVWLDGDFWKKDVNLPEPKIPLKQ